MLCLRPICIITKTFHCHDEWRKGHCCFLRWSIVIFLILFFIFLMCLSSSLISCMKSPVTQMIQIFELLICSADYGTHPFSSPSRDELVYSGPVRIFSMIHHVTEKRAFCSCCGHWLFLACCECVSVCVMACHAHEAPSDRSCWSKASLCCCPHRPMTRHNKDRSGLFSLMGSTDSG